MLPDCLKWISAGVLLGALSGCGITSLSGLRKAEPDLAHIVPCDDQMAHFGSPGVSLWKRGPEPLPVDAALVRLLSRLVPEKTPRPDAPALVTRGLFRFGVQAMCRKGHENTGRHRIKNQFGGGTR